MRAPESRWSGILLGLLLLLWSLAACQEQEVLEQEDILLEMQAIEAKSTASKELVASFGKGRGGVSAQAMAQLWAKHPEWTREQALDAAIRQELVWQSWGGEALEGIPWQELRFARKRGLVDAWIDRELLADELTPVDEAALTAEINKQAMARARPAGYQASHLLVRLPEDASATRMEEGKQALVELRSRIVASRGEGAVTASDLLRVLAQLDEERFEGFEVIVNARMKFPLQPSPPDAMPEEWLNVVPEFAEGAKRVVASRGFGALSDPVKTSFGWHTIVVHERFERRDADRALIERVLRRAVRDRTLQNKLLERMESLYAVYPWSSDPGALEQELIASPPLGALADEARPQP